MKFVLLAFSTVFSLTAFAASPTSFDCEGKSVEDGTKLRVIGTGKRQALKVYINDTLDYDGYLPKTYLLQNGSVSVNSLNDGLERHSEIEFVEGSEWNTMKIYSVQTGKKYLAVNIACAVGH